MNNLKSQQFSNNFSCNTVPNNKMPRNLESELIDFQCNIVDICHDDQLYPALTLDLYSIPANAVSTFNASFHQIPASCHIAGSEKMEQNKLLLKKKFSYLHEDLEASDIVDERTNDQKMTSILRICSQNVIWKTPLVTNPGSPKSALTCCKKLFRKTPKITNYQFLREV